jgi:eukaryotic-like serine/threonine-protein kinase
MEPDRWEQIERLYHAALEREPEARESFLDEACAGDEDMRREVAGLIACDVSGDSFIQRREAADEATLETRICGASDDKIQAARRKAPLG